MTTVSETPEEQWKAIVEVANRATEADIVDESDEKVSADLRAMGMDPEAVGRRGRELVEKLLRESEEPPGWKARDDKPPHVATPVDAEPPSGRSPLPGAKSWFARWTVVQLAAAAVAFLLVAAGAAVALLSHPSTPVPPGPRESPTSPPEVLTASRLRDEAKAKCAAGAWGPCLDTLDEAKALDPAGDLTTEVKTEREKAIMALKEEQDGADAAATDGGKGRKKDKNGASGSR